MIDDALNSEIVEDLAKQLHYMVPPDDIYYMTAINLVYTNAFFKILYETEPVIFHKLIVRNPILNSYSFLVADIIETAVENEAINNQEADCEQDERD